MMYKIKTDNDDIKELIYNNNKYDVKLYNYYLERLENK